MLNSAPWVDVAMPVHGFGGDPPLPYATRNVPEGTNRRPSPAPMCESECVSIVVELTGAAHQVAAPVARSSPIVAPFSFWTYTVVSPTSGASLLLSVAPNV